MIRRVILRRVIGADRNPARLVVVAFALLIAVGTLLLSLPWASDSGRSVGLDHSLFWATSAATVTGLGTVDIDSFSLFGELVLLGLIQLGGFGIMTIGSVLALLASRRIGLRQRMLAQAEIGAVDIGELRTLIGHIARITVAVEVTIALLLFVHLATVDGISLGRAAYSGIFHGVSAFNNAGISLYSDSLTRFAGDPLVVFPVTFAFIIGGLGFPVLVEFGRRVHPRRWSLHTRIVLVATAALLMVGPAVVLTFEWANPDTLGPLGIWDKLQAAWFQGVTPRTAGFNTVDFGKMNEATLNVVTALMFIGAGPASTSGGIKVTTFAILGFVLWSEVRGNADVNVFRRRLPANVIRQALAVALLAIGLVVGTSLLLMSIEDLPLTPSLFEAASAFGTVGLSTGVTGAIGATGHVILILVMLAGRVGPITFVTALALRERDRAYRYPEERPIIG